VGNANPAGDLYVITDDLSGHRGVAARIWLEDHPRIRHAVVPVGARWLGLAGGWGRLFCKAALAGRSFADPEEIDQVTGLATAGLNARARPWVWGRPAPPTRKPRRRFVYCL
jgi:hypothetical protein